MVIPVPTLGLGPRPDPYPIKVLSPAPVPELPVLAPTKTFCVPVVFEVPLE